MTQARSTVNPFQYLSDFFQQSVRDGGVGAITRWAPPMDLFMKDENWIVQAELPGVDPKDVHIQLMGNQLTIRGERKVPEGLKEDDCLLLESPYGPFERTITLPYAVPEDKVEAFYSRGVLTIKLPAVSESAKEIEIHTEEESGSIERREMEGSKTEGSQKEESKREESKKEEMPKAA